MKNEYVDEGVPFLRSQNIRPFEISLDNLVFIPAEFDRRIAKSRLAPGDIAIVRTGYPGTAAVVPDGLPKSNCSDLVIMRPGPDVSPHFLVSFFNSAFGKRMVLGKLVGAAQKHFNVGAAKSVVLHMPPLPEQRRIIDRVDEVRAEVARLELLHTRKLAALDELKQSLLHQAFSGQLR
jgi:type I restriction enzyme, S subunit